MMKRNKKWIILPVLAAVFAVAAGVCIKNDVFGMFTPKEPYVTGEPESMSSVVVTNEGSNWQGEMGTGAKPCDEKVPTCSGKKGSKTNPFVVLEVLADPAQQQMTYLAAEDDSSDPLDIMQIGIDMASKEGNSYVPGSSRYMSRDQLKSMGQWFCNWEYEVKAIGGNGDTEMIHYVDIEKLYSLEITSEDLKEAGISEEEFAQKYSEGMTQKFSRNLYDIPALIKKYPALFKSDDDDKEIRQIAKDDIDNWDTSYERKVVKEAVSESYSGKGFILAVAPGEGDFGFASQEDCNNWIFTKTGTDADRWVYVENESDIPEEYVAAYSGDDARLFSSGFYYKTKGITGWTSNSDLYSQYNESADITGLYMSLAGNPGATCRYDIEPEETKDIYTFSYYGITNNNILKRQLFVFNSEKDYEEFNLQVICMTPSELNELAKKDTDETVDMIERADMFYIGGYDSSTNNIANVYKLYYEYVLGQTEYDTDKIASFADDDLEWDLCYKLIYRLCNNKNLPLVMTNVLGKLANEGTTTIQMYQNETYPNVSRKAALSNFAKLYIIATQFDLTAKKSEDEGFVRTFYDDILIPGRLEKIALTDGAKNNSDSPAQYTGYYERPKVIDSEDMAEKEKCYYLWNTLTFFPEALESCWYNSTQLTVDVDKFVSYGYMRSYFDVDSPANLFSGGSEATKVNGSDGIVGNVAIPYNANNGGYSTLLGNTESAYVTNTTMNTAFLIMNNRPEVINAQVVKVMKQKKEYVKMSDTDVLLDYVSDQSYGEQKSYIKVQIHNNNNGEAGVVTKVTLKNSEGKTAPVNSTLKLYTSKEYNEECKEVTYGSLSGYNIPNTETLIAYVPYSLQQWADGYHIIEFETVGRIYSQKKKKILTGSPVKTEVNIGERTLFNLE